MYILKIIYFSMFFYLTQLREDKWCSLEPLCSCRQHMDMYNIDCSEVTDPSSVTTLLQNRVAELTINELNFKEGCNLTSLPNFAFNFSSVRIFNTSCPFFDIPVNAFSGNTWLTEVSLSDTTFLTVPEGLRNLRSLKTLSLRHAHFSSLQDELCNLTSLVILDFSEGALRELSGDAFIGNPNLQCVNLSHNNLDFVHPETLKPLKFLQKIYLRGNQIFSVDGLFRISNLEIIDLYDNKLVSLDSAFPEDMWVMKELNIGKNPLQHVNSSAFGFRFRHLKIFDMTDARCPSIDRNLLLFFPSIEKVFLRGNNIYNISKFFHNLSSLRTIDLTDNHVTSVEDIFSNNPKIKSLFLAMNEISDIKDSLHGLAELKRLNLSRNYIQHIQNDNFKGLQRLRFLDLSHNLIAFIESNSFSGLPKLKLIDLSSNIFVQLNKSLQNLVSLKTLHLSSIALRNIDREEFDGLTKLSKLSLQENKIISLNGVFEKLYRLNSLNISGNRLRTLSRDTFPEEINLLELSFAMNELVCDCRLTWMIKWLADTNSSFLLDNPICSSPGRLKGNFLKDLTEDDLTEWTEGCPTPCRCECVVQGRNFYVRADCSDRRLFHIPDILPRHLGDLDMSKNHLRLLDPLNESLSKYLSILNLEANEIISLDMDSIPRNLKVLKLAGNRFRKLAWSRLPNESLEMLTLSGNPWICDCEAVTFKKWLLSQDEIVVDINETRCGTDDPFPELHGKVMISLKDTDLCPSVLSLYVSISLAFLGIMLLCTSIVLFYSRYRLYIKVWLYARGYTWVKEDETNVDKLFDAVISYTPMDEMFVLTVVAPGLEDFEPKFSLCIPERDIVSGVFTVVTTMKAVQDSKRIIIILDEDYINDEFCMSIFRQAFQLSLEDKINRMIVIKIGEISASDVLDPDLKVTLESTRCIMWGEKLFWEKLRYAMPKKTKNLKFEDGSKLFQDCYLKRYSYK